MLKEIKVRQGKGLAKIDVTTIYSDLRWIVSSLSTTECDVSSFHLYVL
jgi:hypothetical protein